MGYTPEPDKHAPIVLEGDPEGPVSVVFLRFKTNEELGRWPNITVPPSTDDQVVLHVGEHIEICKVIVRRFFGNRMVACFVARTTLEPSIEST